MEWKKYAFDHLLATDQYQNGQNVAAAVVAAERRIDEPVPVASADTASRQAGFVAVAAAAAKACSSQAWTAQMAVAGTGCQTWASLLRS